MVLERFFKILLSPPENQVDKLVKDRLKENEKVVKDAKIQDLFNLSYAQMTTFKACFTYYLVLQKSYEIAYLSKHPLYEIDAKDATFGEEARDVIHDNEVNNMAIEKLKTDMEKHLNSYPNSVSPNAHSIRNAANITSILYLDCWDDKKRKFNEEIEQKAEYINRKIFTKNSKG